MLYPLKFHPILKEKIWGGDKLKTLLNKTSDKTDIGESWEISTVDNNASIVSNGVFEGKSLQELIDMFTSELLGKSVYKEFGAQFPLLVKFIDAKENLSVQLHPNDELSKKRHNSFGKTEMWYVVQADADAELIVGFKEDVSKKKYNHYLEANKIEQLLNFEHISEGDSYFINTGKIHAIGAGSLIAEIQQTSDITYRLYDWDRKDKNGVKRELHTDLALEAIDFESKEDFKLHYDRSINQLNLLVSCQYFTTNFLKVENKYIRDYSDLDSFVILMCVDKSFKIKLGEIIEEVVYGETILLPANVKNVVIEAEETSILEIFVS
ncbi:class I mannose-6-phosphate isomerase [Aquimarina sp. MMG015]|nr:type I phosphomannose isomerase catalytic subunit [Aquimarina sp. MMG015]MBQ4801427.1 class I mannose-6-phosphate isomerase [Aquimarina sp. MMG015]